MKNRIIYFIAICVVLFLLGCNSSNSPPKDTSGKTPDQFLLETYQLIVNGQFDEAEKRFSPAFLEKFVYKNYDSFSQYFLDRKTGLRSSDWKSEWLKAKLIGNDYNDDLWRAKIIVDAGKGAENPPGVVNDLYLIDGVWKIVFWGDYPES